MSLTALHRFGDDDLNPKEVVIYRARLHFIAFIVSSKTWIVLSLIGFVILFYAYLYRSSIGFLQDTTITIGVILFASLFLLYGGYKFSVRFIDWLYDEDIITNQRVVDYNQKYLFAKEVSTANMKAIEDVILVKKGILRTFFDYGTLDIQTSATARITGPNGLGKYLLLEDIAQPKRVQHLIDNIAFRVKKEVTIDPDELLIGCGLLEGNLEEYFIVKKSVHWKERIRKLVYIS